MQTILEIVLSNAVLATGLALLAATVARLCRRPALVHALWLLVLLKLITPPLVPVSVSWLNLGSIPLRAGKPATAAVTTPGGDAASTWNMAGDAGPADQSAERVFFLEATEDRTVEEMPAPVGPANIAELLAAWVQPWLAEAGVPIWIGVSLLWFGCTTLHGYRFQHLLRYAKRAPRSIQQQTQALAAQMGLKDCPGVWLVPGALSPMLWFAGRTPRLLFPARLLDQLDGEQRATLLVHELAHYRRGDHWLRLLEMLVTGLFWWHPVVWWARHELHEAEEQCCDAWVVWALAGADRAYATALLQTVAFISQSRCPLPAAASGIGEVRHLRRRLTMIMQGKTPRSLSWAGLLAIVGLGLFLLPVRAQAPRSDTEREIEKLKQALKALEEKHRAEKEDAAESKKASAEEIAEAKEEAAKLGKVAESKRREFEAAVQQHHRAMARLAKLQGKPLHSYGLWIEDGKLHTSGEGSPYRVIGVPGEKGNKETVILRMTPDGKTERVEGHALTVPAETIGKGEHRIILSVSPDTKYDVVKKKLAELNASKEKPHIMLEVAPADKHQSIQKSYEYRLITPEGKTNKPAEKIHGYELKVTPAEQGKIYHFDTKVPEGKQGYFHIERAPDVKPGEKTFRYEIEKRFDGKAGNSKTKTSDRAAELEKKIEQLQKEIQELKDALKKSGASLPGASGSLKGIAGR